ncbi:TerD family protein [uncultured Thiodictyon sp.]|uniref:TerD family protein n=1 Tax=uncultured Thiodictyon sp. TaxID=1846217 RepID=UPI0025FEA6D4|nr:TerD family protein [uncultured Thiodictyon sp.]
MALNLSKGDRISLEKTGGPGLTRVILGLGWGKRKKKGFFGASEIEVDLDASCLIFAAGKLVDTVWFRQLKSQDGAVRHTGDDRSGGGSDDNEQISVELTKLPPTVDVLVFTVNSFLNDSFEGIPNALCRLLDGVGNKELARFDLSLDGANNTGMVMAKLYRENGAWNLQAIGEKGMGRTFNELMPLISRHL